MAPMRVVGAASIDFEPVNTATVLAYCPDTDKTDEITRGDYRAITNNPEFDVYMGTVFDKHAAIFAALMTTRKAYFANTNRISLNHCVIALPSSVPQLCQKFKQRCEHTNVELKVFIRDGESFHEWGTGRVVDVKLRDAKTKCAHYTVERVEKDVSQVEHGAAGGTRPSQGAVVASRKRPRQGAAKHPLRQLRAELARFRARTEATDERMRELFALVNKGGQTELEYDHADEDDSEAYDSEDDSTYVDADEQDDSEDDSEAYDSEDDSTYVDADEQDDSEDEATYVDADEHLKIIALLSKHSARFDSVERRLELVERRLNLVVELDDPAPGPQTRAKTKRV